MIKIKDFRRIESEVKNAIHEVFEYAQENEKDENDYFLFLCNATYVDMNFSEDYSPYVIDYRMDDINDSHRRGFLTTYLQSQYNFNNFNTSDSRDSLTIEMMLYSHIWESTTFLKQLSKLLDLCETRGYNWKTEVPNAQNEQSKQKYIRETLRNGFQNHKLKLGEIIKEGYQSQLRNAFAHSDYSFNETKILLHNYKPNGYQVKDITIDEWTERFCYSVLLNFHLLNKIYEERQKIDVPIEVFLRNKNGDKENGVLKYNKERNSFSANLL